MKMHSQGVMVKSSPSPSPAFVHISDKDLTEIELHSVDSISDLHRTHTEQHSKGVRPPRPRPPSTNGTLQMLERPVVFQTGHQKKRSHWNQLSSVCAPSRRRYSMVCATVILILLTLILIFSFLVQQSRALTSLSEVVRHREETAEELSLLLQELQALRRNMSATRNAH
ncbi:uncharacterized protein si:dkey-20d21.12 [Colossoma macropomum]|uniref:uncharacterized protein si:dkey-20d21.12 n=1 Tax=Colossoma macropomum TaxID=42526 RepID=UPI001864CD4B|nr:uncharacterized protein si:dkey-20d21.12 [Colossoma macropomum]